MKSIDNLREYALTAASVNATTRAVLAGYVDEIEREVEELRDRDYRNGREDAEGAVEFADRLKSAVDRREDVTLFGVDYTPLPIDADGVPIHVGDVMEFTYDPPQDQPLFEVSGFGADETLFYAARGEVIPRKVTKASVVRHHHAPTVEDVLREYALKCEEAGNSGPEVKRLAAEYAAKLWLAGEDA